MLLSGQNHEKRFLKNAREMFTNCLEITELRQNPFRFVVIASYNITSDLD